MRHLLLSVVSMFAMVATPAMAHDFWIEPSNTRPARGDAVKLALRVGDTYPGDAVPRNPAKIDRFFVVGPSGETAAAAGRDGVDPAGSITPDADGLWIVGYRSKPSPVSLDAAKFEGYLREKGLEHVIEARAAAGQSGDAASEMFSRCAKTVVRAGSANATGTDRELGLRCEIVADGDPTSVKLGDTLRVRVLYEGKPAPGLLVTSLNTTGGGTPAAPVRTDAGGRAAFVVDRPGLWILNVVHMGRAPEGSGAAWESLWASLTFDVPLGAAAKHDDEVCR